jgi:myo-inositol 2-dehydrogenase/D-chiro-inositol 1-dehydrogenase
MVPVGVRVGFVGLGRMGRTHLDALDRTGRLHVVAVADPAPEARAFAEERGLGAFGSIEELVAADQVDVAIVASPTSTHLDAVRRLAAAGIHVLSEKPCGYRADEARAAGEAAERADVVLQIGYWKRFAAPLRDLRDRIERGGLGDISLISCFQWDERPPSPVFRAVSGGPAIDMAVHEFDLMRWLTGQDIVAVTGHASTTTFEPAVEADPESLALVTKLSGGAVGIVSVGRRFVEGDAHRLQVIGTAGAADVPYVWPPHGQEDFLAALVAQAEAFADATEGGAMTGASASDAVAALEAAALAGRGSAVA